MILRAWLGCGSDSPLLRGGLVRSRTVARETWEAQRVRPGGCKIQRSENTPQTRRAVQLLQNTKPGSAPVRSGSPMFIMSSVPELNAAKMYHLHEMNPSSGELLLVFRAD